MSLDVHTVLVFNWKISIIGLIFGQFTKEAPKNWLLHINISDGGRLTAKPNSFRRKKGNQIKSQKLRKRTFHVNQSDS